MPIIVCPNCGYMIVNPSQPCPSCGADISALTPPQPPVMASNSSRDQYRYRYDGDDSHDGISTKKIVAIVCVVVILFVGGGSFFYHGFSR
ncbi:MAG: zinc-ribbon domain-containing protein [Synergistaceae bacterium]|nr:zinc-ribbon domain-containing protein [Synergistaceae bacterium]